MEAQESVEFADADALGDAGADLLCRVGDRHVTVPRLLIQPGSAVRQPGDHGRLVIPRWLAIGLGLVSPFGAN